MFSNSVKIKNITAKQMNWLINNNKVRYVESEGLWFSNNYFYVWSSPTMEDPEGHWEVWD